MMALQLNDPVTALKNVGDKRKKLYEKLGVKTVEDLLRFYPRSYIDYTSPKLGGRVRSRGIRRHRGQSAPKTHSRSHPKKHGAVQTAAHRWAFQRDAHHFQQEYAYYGMKVGETYLFHGKFSTMGGSYQMTLSSFIRAEDGEVMRPVYNLTEGRPTAWWSTTSRKRWIIGGLF